MKISIVFLFFVICVHTASGYELGSDYWFTDDYTVKADNGDEFKLTEVSDYHIEGRVLGVKFYSDRVILSPVDVAIGTGKLSEEEYVKHLETEMGNRYVYWYFDDTSILPMDYVMEHTSNNHLIASDSEVFGALKDVSAGDFISINGSLVNVEKTGKGGFTLTTSTRRDDMGSNSCEVILVKEVSVVKPPELISRNNVLGVFLLFFLLLILAWVVRR